jgi:chromosome segregation ATPase
LPGASVVLIAAVVASLALAVLFFRWRQRREVVSETERGRLTSSTGDPERADNEIAEDETASAVELASIGRRLEEVLRENDQLRGWLRDLEQNLEHVTREATMLVNSLRDNELRWEQAEAEQHRTRSELTSSRAALEEAATRTTALEEALQVERGETAALGAANRRLAEQLQQNDRDSPTVDLRDHEWAPRRWRQRRAGRSFGHSHGTLPD